MPIDRDLYAEIGKASKTQQDSRVIDGLVEEAVLAIVEVEEVVTRVEVKVPIGLESALVY